MTIKELAYSAQQHLQSRASVPFKRAHIYEMLAASFGFKSYAALTSDSVFTYGPFDGKPASLNKFAICQRCIDFGYQRETAEIISAEFSAFVMEQQLYLIRLSELVGMLRDGFSPQTGAEDDEQGDNSDVTPEYLWSESYPEMITPILLEGLESAANKSIPLAHYALALIHDVYQDDENIVPSFWHDQAQQGRVLTGVEREWADAYAKQTADAGKYAYHLQEAARLGSTDAMLDLAERFGDPTFFAQADGLVVDDPARVAEIAQSLGREDDVRGWLIKAAEAGDIEAMHRLIDDYDYHDLKQCWKWLYLAALLGTDLTQSNQYAIHEDGSKYDDDVGGAIFVTGDEGVDLTALDPKQDVEARQAAQDIFRLIQLTD